MTYVLAEPQIMAAVAEDIEWIGASIEVANTAAANSTSHVLAAATDEVSAAIAKLFADHGHEYQAVANQVRAFHSQLHQSLTAAAGAYVQAETTNVAALLGAARAPFASTAPTAAAIPPFPANDVTLFPGATGFPIPTPAQIEVVNSLFVRSTGILRALFTPQEGYPMTGTKSLPFDTSVRLGVTILENTLYDLIHNEGQSVTVTGLSQSAIIATDTMRNLASGTSIFGASPPTADQLNFVLLGNELTPNGGMFSRFPQLYLPSVGLTFGGATPPDTIYPTANYTLEYDGFADFPRYPLNIISNLNALAGIFYVHPAYLDLTPGQVDNAILLPTSPGYSGVTSYYMIRTQNLPLLEPLRAMPVLGNPLANLVQPTLKVIVNLGYGDPAYGFSTDYADVPTTFGLFPDVSPVVVADALAAGVEQGVNDFARDMRTILAQPITMPSLPISSTADLVATSLTLPSPMEVVNTAASITANSYAVLLPTADIGLSMVTTVPVYLVQIGLDQLLQGSLINAVGYPIAAIAGLGSIAGGIELLTIGKATMSNISAIQRLTA